MCGRTSAGAEGACLTLSLFPRARPYASPAAQRAKRTCGAKHLPPSLPNNMLRPRGGAAAAAAAAAATSYLGLLVGSLAAAAVDTATSTPARAPPVLLRTGMALPTG